MPFTLSHTAAVAPFLKSRYFSATGLIVGAMAPDFEYFIRMNVKGIYGHTLWGIFYFDLPVALIIAILFHTVAKKNLIDNLPGFLQMRSRETRELDFISYLKDHKMIFAWSVVLGAATHILWDGFTHERQFGVRAFPVIYEGRTVRVGDVNYPLWYALQHISTYTGGLILIIYVLRMKAIPGTIYKQVTWYWLALIALIALITYVRMQFKFGNLWYVVLAITACSAVCISITILGLVPFRKQTGTTQ
ncbi:MAG TPA: DUF4184 family protein [Cyclobacteriaceae bacterium]